MESLIVAWPRTRYLYPVRDAFDPFRPGRSVQPRPVAPPAEQALTPEPGAEQRTEARASGHELVLVKWSDSGGRSRVERGRITDRSKKGLGLLTASPIPVGTLVSVTGGTSIGGIVKNCGEGHGGYTIGLLRLPPERRVSERRLVQGTATLIWHESEGVERTASAPVLNATPSGLQVQTSVAMPVPALVRIIGPGVERVAETCYQERNGDRFLVGLRFLKDNADETSSTAE